MCLGAKIGRMLTASEKARAIAAEAGFNSHLARREYI